MAYSETATPLRIVRDESWMEHGACRRGEANWFPVNGEGQPKLRLVCARCPVRLMCLTYALEYDERSGVWGGQSERQRRELKRSGTPAAVAIARLDKWAAARVVETPPRVVVRRARPSRAPGSGHLVGRPVSYGSYVRGCRCSGCVQSRSDYRADLRRRKQERTAS